MTGDPAVVVGGTGMLGGLVRELVRRGHDVIVPARNPAPAGRWVAADWSEPEQFVARVAEALGGAAPALVVLWCHRPHRAPVAAGLGALLDARARVVEVIGTSSWARDTSWARRHLPGSMLAALGQASAGGGWLSDEAIAQGVLDACDAAEPGRPGVRVVGFLPDEARRALAAGDRGLR